MSKQQTPSEIQQQLAILQEENQRLAQQNLRLVLLAKEKDRKLYQYELALRRYRTRLVRWFEDMAYDPLETEFGEGEVAPQELIELQKE
ncbi:hypothetical protein SS50377_24445 [Spironucleus salmonicida]|uniref:Uncharacterized protein n=1 Tax=Spironucleus salmonicida TaxID=348837 RepID=V6LQM5_9EUKA|nr:hypothetical protein SS50377_24445 [Spironucleus salmonicida]|eukprot:EST46006.1 hypothetical protein SS50377_13992 [Spironucleus salmonicida]